MNREDQLALCERAMVRFGPKFWCKPGADFDGSGAVFWTGGDAIQDGEVSQELEDWAHDNGFYFEFYDSETLLGYSIEE